MDIWDFLTASVGSSTVSIRVGNGRGRFSQRPNALASAFLTYRVMVRLGNEQGGFNGA